MATLKGVWTIGKKLWFKDIGEHLLNGIETTAQETPFVKIASTTKVDSWGDTNFIIAWYDADGEDIGQIFRYGDTEEVVDSQWHYTFDLGDVEQTVSDEFYEWWTSSFIEFTPEKVLGSWKFSDDITLGLVRDTTILFEDAQGNTYDQIRKGYTDMGDATVEAHNMDTEEWTIMFTIPWGESAVWNDEFKQIKVLSLPENKTMYGIFAEGGIKIPEVNVVYNDTLSASLVSGDTATLPIASKKMKSDIKITVPESAFSNIPIEVSTEAEMTALLTSGEIGGVYKYTGTTGTYENGALYVLEEEEYNLTLSASYSTSGIAGQITYIKLNSQPTSDSDYDYDSKTLYENGSATVQTSSYWHWTSHEDYTSATEVMLTEDKSATFSYIEHQGGSND